MPHDDDAARPRFPRNKTAALIIASAAAAFFLVPSSCARAPRYSIDASITDEAGASALSAYPVPGHWRLVEPPEADIVVSAEASWGAYMTDVPGARAASAEAYAVAADWLDPRESLSSAETGLEAAASLAEPLSSIALPRKALAYDGLYPGDPGYPLVKSVLVRAAPAGRDRRGRYALEAASYLDGLPEAAPPGGLTWIGAVGDLMPGQGTAARLLEPDGPSTVFKRLLPIMKSQDLLIANLETAVTERGVEWPKTFRFRMPAAALGPLIDSGIDVVGIANNHVYDYTDIGFSDTVAALRSAGLPFIGAGMDRDEAIRPFEWSSASGRSSANERATVWALAAFPVERTGFNGLVHASVQRGEPGLLWADDEAVAEIERSLAAMKDDGRLLVVSVHAGSEYVYGPNAVQTRLYRSLVAAGADLVLGHHPLVLQPMEWYEGSSHAGLIVYSLGNFVFDDVEDNPKGLESMLLSLGVSDGRIRALRVYPARMDGYTVDLDDGDSIRTLLWTMSESWAEER